MTSHEKHWKLGIWSGLGSAAAFGVLGLFVRRLSSSVPIEEIVFFRGIVSVVFLTPYLRFKANSATRIAWLSLSLRAIAGAGSVLCYFSNLRSIPVADAAALSNTAPLFVAVVGFFVLRESLSLKSSFGLGTVIIGSMILQSPSGSSLDRTSFLIGLLGALMASVAYLSLQRAAKTFPQTLIVWLFGLTTSLAAIVTSHQNSWKFPDLATGLALITMGTLGLVGQLWMTQAYLHLPSSVAAALGLTALIWGGTGEVLLTGVWPNAGALIGYALILGGAWTLQQRRAIAMPDSQNKLETMATKV